MKRSILVLMLVVFALVTVVPTFAMPQDFHGVTVPQIVDPNDGIGVPQVVDPNDGIGVPQIIDPNDAAVDYFGIIIEEGIIILDGIVVDYASLNFTRKAGGEQQDYL